MQTKIREKHVLSILETLLQWWLNSSWPNSTLISNLSWLTLLKKRVQSLYNRSKALCTFLLPYLSLFQGTLCPQQPSFKMFLATEHTFVLRGPIGHFLCIRLRPKATFWHLLWKEQDNHTQSDEGSFCCKCQNSTQRCFLCVEVWSVSGKQRMPVKSKGQSCPQALHRSRERPVDLATHKYASFF